MSADLVWAHGDNGPELVPRSETVVIESMPFGPDNAVIPATIRSFADRTPTRLLGCKADRRHDAVQVSFACTPFVRYTLGGKNVMGEECSCMVFTTAQARDPIFDGLTKRERDRIVRAAQRLEIRRSHRGMTQ